MENKQQFATTLVLKYIEIQFSETWFLLFEQILVHLHKTSWNKKNNIYL